MTVAETKEKLFASGEFVFEEFQRLQFFFGLKHEIRYKNERTIVKDAYDSVAEHVYGMHIAFQYFWPLEDEHKSWDATMMLSMITLHDIEEVITGDVIGYDKTEADRQAEAQAMQGVFTKTPEFMKDNVKTLLEAYEKRESKEAKFVKAIDKIEPLIHLYNQEGKEMLHVMGTTFEQNASIKVPHFKEFPVIMRFYEVIASRMKKEGFFK